MSQIKGWFLLIIGIGIAAIAVQGLFRGWLPSGRNGFRQGEGVSRESQPIGFWFFFLLYFGGGLYVAIYALGLMMGWSLPSL
jgi:hypothetical protein